MSYKYVCSESNARTFDRCTVSSCQLCNECQYCRVADMYRIFFSTIFNHIDWFALKSLQRGSEAMFYQVTFFVVDNLWVVITEEPQS